MIPLLASFVNTFFYFNIDFASFWIYNIVSERGDILKDRIKEVRKHFNLTQTDFGTKIGVKGNTITGYETGLRTPSDAVILSICREFNVSEEWLRTGKGEMLIQTSALEKAYNRFGYIMENSSPSKKAALSMLLEMLYAIPDEEWNLVMKQIDEIKKEG